MADLKQLQERVYKNKIAKGFNVTDVYREFCYMFCELYEACEAYMDEKKRKDGIGEELADVMIYLLGLSEILGVDLEAELMKKIEINEKRKYINKDGVAIRVEE